MSLLKFYATFPILVIAGTVLSIPFKMWKRHSVGKSAWSPKEAMENLARLSQSTPEELSHHICPKALYRLVPFLHQGQLGVETQKEADAIFDNMIEIGSIGVGTAAAMIPIAKWFGICLSNAGLGTCAKLGVEDLFSLSGVQLLAGAYLISQIAKHFFIAPVINVLGRDGLVPHRTLLISNEYTILLKALNEAYDLPHNDPKSIEAAQIAKQFLRLSPHIAKELHDSLALDNDKAKELIIPLQTACRQIMAKQALENVPGTVALGTV